MHSRLGRWLHPLFRTRPRAALSLVALAVLAAGSWQGLRAARFHWCKSAAEEALGRYDFREASRQLDVCLALWPDDPAALLLAAQAARRQGRLDDADALLDRHRRAAGTATPEARLQAMLVRVQQGQVKSHVYLLIEDIEVRHPASEQIMESLALGSVHVYRLDEASFWTKQLLDRFPANPVGRLLDAQTHETLRRRERALEITRRLVADYPTDDRARLYLASLLLKTRDYEGAAREYREVRLHQPRDLGALLGLLAALQALDRAEEAAPLLRELEEHHADSAAALLERARVALRADRPADGEPLLRRAAALAPNDHAIRLDLATCLERLGRPDEARPHLDRFRESEADMKRLDEAFQATIKTPSDLAPRMEAGRICLRNGQAAEGVRWLLGVLDLAPGHRPAHQLLAEHFESVGEDRLAGHHRALSR